MPDREIEHAHHVAERAAIDAQTLDSPRAALDRPVHDGSSWRFQ